MARRILPHAPAATLNRVVLAGAEIAVEDGTGRPRLGDGLTAGGRSLAFESEVATKASAADLLSSVRRLDAIEGAVTSGRRGYAAWADAFADTSPAVDTLAEVPISDTGTHMQGGVQVPNSGVYRRVADPAIVWLRLYDMDAAIVMAAASRAEGAIAQTGEIRDEVAGYAASLSGATAQLEALSDRFSSITIPGLTDVMLYANGMVITATGVDPKTGATVTYFADGTSDAQIVRFVPAAIPGVAEITLYPNGVVAAGNDPETIYHQLPAVPPADGSASDARRFKDQTEIAPLPLTEVAAFVRNGDNWLWNGVPEPQQTEATAVRLPSGYRVGNTRTVSGFCCLLIGGSTDNAAAKIGWNTGTLAADLNSLTWGTAVTLVNDTFNGVTSKLQKGSLYNSGAGRGRLFVGRIPNEDGYSRGIWEIYTSDHVNWVGKDGGAFAVGGNTNGMIAWDNALLPSDLTYVIPSPSGGIYADGVEYLPCYGVPDTTNYRTIIYARSDPNGPMSEWWSISTYRPGDAARGGGYAGAEPAMTRLPDGNLLIVCRPANKANNLPINGVPWWIVAPNGADVAHGNFEDIPGVMIGGGLLCLQGPNFGRLLFVGPRSSAGSGMSDRDWSVFLSYDQGPDHVFRNSVTPWPERDKRSRSLTGRQLPAEYWYLMNSGNSAIFPIDATRFVTMTERGGPTNTSGVTGAYNAIGTTLMTVANAIRKPEAWENAL